MGNAYKEPTHLKKGLPFLCNICNSGSFTMIQNRILGKYLFIVKDKENQDSSQAVFQLCTFVMRQAPYWKFHSGRHQTQSPASRAGLIQARSLNQACVSFVQQSKTSSTFPFLGQSSYLRNNVGDYDHNDLHRHLLRARCRAG